MSEFFPSNGVDKTRNVTELFPSKGMENVSELFPSDSRYGESNGDMNGEIRRHSLKCNLEKWTHPVLMALVALQL